MQKGRTVTLHTVSSLDGFIAKKDNGSPGWRVLEASTKPVLEQRSFTKRKLKFCDTLSKHLSFASTSRLSACQSPFSLLDITTTVSGPSVGGTFTHWNIS